ncbi:MAG: MFS transporter [Magnetococcales bacterium]|nr:MFS transporter [Magnetococcales bacterium]MBF0322457.1 MFS transporter [Magnetococcales bacterium]
MMGAAPPSAQSVSRILGGYYFFYFAGLGVWIPYWPLYLKGLHLDPAAIGLLLSLPLAMKVFGPPVWGALADGGARHGVIVGTSFAALFTFVWYFFGRDFQFLLIVTTLYSFFLAGPLALVEATTMEIVTRIGSDYGRIRLWGSLGFILFSFLLGPILDRWGNTPLLWVVGGLLLANALLTLLMPRPEPQTRHAKPRRQTRLLFATPGLPWFYLAALLMQFSHAAYYGFLSIHLEQNGFSRKAIGILWALGVVAEVVVLRWSGYWVERLGPSRILTGSILVAVIRWGLFATTLWWPLLILAQLCHGFTFGSYHVAAIRRTHEAAPPGARATAQAWYIAFAYGLGGGVGLAFSGHLYDHLGAKSLFAIMAIAALAGSGASALSNRSFRHAR